MSGVGSASGKRHTNLNQMLQARDCCSHMRAGLRCVLSINCDALWNPAGDASDDSGEQAPSKRQGKGGRPVQRVAAAKPEPAPGPKKSKLPQAGARQGKSKEAAGAAQGDEDDALKRVALQELIRRREAKARGKEHGLGSVLAGEADGAGDGVAGLLGSGLDAGDVVKKKRRLLVDKEDAPGPRGQEQGVEEMVLDDF